MQCFVYFFRDVSYETIGFETTFGQTAFKSGLETYDSVVDVPQQVKKCHVIAQAALGGSGGRGWLWEPLGRSGGALEEIWEALIYKKNIKI